MNLEPCRWCGEPTHRLVLVRHPDELAHVAELMAPACEHHATTLLTLDEYGQLTGAERGSRIAHEPAQLTIAHEAYRDEHMRDGHSLVYPRR